MNHLNKVTSIIIVSFFLFSLSANSQSASKFKFGLKGALNMGYIQAKSKTVESNGIAMGYSYGLMGDYQFTNSYSLSSEFLISTLNGNMKMNGDVSFKIDANPKDSLDDLNYKLTLQYIQIPISMKFRTKEIGYITYWAQFGIAPGFLISSRADLTGSLPTSVEILDPTNININKEEGDDFVVDGFDDQVFPIRMSMIIGGGIEYSLAGSTSLYAGLRLNNSFTDIFVADPGVNANNSAVSINIGLFF